MKKIYALILALASTAVIAADLSTFEQTVPYVGANKNVNLGSHSLTASSIIGALTGNAGTASALFANGANCSAGSYPLGVDASGASESCTALSGATVLTATGNSGTATALAANPTNCSAGNYPLGIDASGNVESCTAAGGGGTVTQVSVTTANGVSGSVATDTTTPAITLTLGAVTPSSVNGVVISGSATPTLAVTGTTTVSGANTGDQTSVSGNAGTATALAADGANCSAGNYPLGVDASGAVQNCTVAAIGTVTNASNLTDSALMVGDGGTVGAKTTTTGANVVTALGVAVGTDGAFVVKGGVGGTPSSLDLANATGATIPGGGTGKTTANDAAFAIGNDTLSAGVISAADINAIITVNGTKRINTTAFVVALRATNSPTAAAKVFSIGALTDVFGADFTVSPNHILLTYHATTPTWSFATTDTSNGNSVIHMGFVLYINNVVHMIFNVPDIRGNATQLAQHKDWHLHPTSWELGSAIGESATPFRITISEGDWWKKYREYVTNTGGFTSISGAGTANAFWMYANLSGGWSQINAAGTAVAATTSPTLWTIPQTLYADPANAAATALTTNSKWGYADVYLGISDGDVRLVMGNLNGANEAAVVAAPLQSPLPVEIDLNGYVYIGRYTYVKIGATISQSLTSFVTSTALTPVMSHASLSNVQGANTGVTAGHIDDAAQTIYGVKTFNDGVVTPSLNGNQLAGNRNIILNGGFPVNQRGYVSGATLAQGVPSTGVGYGHDGWRGGAGGGTYSFTQLAGNTTITIAANKTLIQAIEDKEVRYTSYVLSWTGTSVCRYAVNSATPAGSYAASPVLITGQTVGTTMSIECGNGASSGTLGLVQLEPGSVATPFENIAFEATLAKARRLLPAINSTGTIDSFAQGYITTTNAGVIWYRLDTPPRISPTGIITTAASTFTGIAGVGSSVLTSLVWGGVTSLTTVQLNWVGTGTPYTVGQGCDVYMNSATAQILFIGGEL